MEAGWGGGGGRWGGTNVKTHSDIWDKDEISYYLNTSVAAATTRTTATEQASGHDEPLT